MPNKEYAPRVATVPRRVRLDPLDDRADIFGGGWPLRRWRKTIRRVNTQQTLAGKISKDIAVHFSIEIPVAANIRTAMDEHDDRDTVSSIRLMSEC
jgi:hypothetical protein